MSDHAVSVWSEFEGVVKSGSIEEQLLHRIDPERLPGHVAVIMDGNGRWARNRHLPRVEGHRAGIQSVRETVETASRLHFDVLTLYAFSVENWKRPAIEVSTLMGLLKKYLNLEIKTLMKNNIRFHVLGRVEPLAPEILDELRRAEEKTSQNSGLHFNIALNYGGRAEIIDACRSLLVEAQNGGLREINEEAFARHLYTAGQPDPDLLIRTSGEFRLSNFLLWQIAYSEIWVTPTMWPDFRMKNLFEAIIDYQKRDRRYGGI